MQRSGDSPKITHLNHNKTCYSCQDNRIITKHGMHSANKHQLEPSKYRALVLGAQYY